MKGNDVTNSKQKNNSQSSIYKSPLGEQAVLTFYDQILRNWPVPFTTKIVNTRYGDTFIIVNGQENKNALILLHGSSSNALSWIADISQYSQFFRVFAVDVIGEPGKSAPSRPAWDGPGYAEWMEDVVNGLALEKVSIIGLSQGGWIALKYATYQPERVNKLVLLTPAGIVPTRGSFILKALLFSMLGSWGAEKLNRVVFGNQVIDPLALEFMNVIMNNFNSRIEKEYLFSDRELMHLSMPTLVVGGLEDAVRPVENIASRLQRLVPQFKSVMIPEMGHVLAGISGRVLPFLSNSQ